ncbi:MAG TPA: type VI secretion system-associated FHA domain protein TagH [Burkholderiaceae bacterium]|jgi:FHA domain-containing protein|nr:type VI secretion system-associated FHA domain protein TagH [Burkholderiaceae bacterium]
MIKLTVVSYNNQTTLTPLSAVFGRDGGTLGRSDTNYFVLPDPKNLVSRIQASIKSDGSKHVITNLSQANPILLNGKEIDFDCEYTLNPGDEMQIGLYVLRAELHLVAVDNTIPVQTQFEATMELPPTQAVVRSVPTNAPAAEPADLPPPPAPSAPLPSAPARPMPNLAELHQKKTEASALRARQSDDAAATPGNDSHPDANPEAHHPSISDADADILMHAFLKGAGIPTVNLNAGMTPEFMEMLGRLLATSVQGTFQLLATRASLKKEVKADVTMVVVRNNNPLKFLSNSETVLVQMLRKKMPGFMGPNEALKDAFADLQAHQSGMVAGMNGAISEVLKRFDPKAMEEQLEGSKLDKLVPLHRKARMWDQYDTMFDEINREAQKDYQKLFGRAFLKAYEKEIERSRNEGHND